MCYLVLCICDDMCFYLCVYFMCELFIDCIFNFNVFSGSRVVNVFNSFIVVECNFFNVFVFIIDCVCVFEVNLLSVENCF